MPTVAARRWDFRSHDLAAARRAITGFLKPFSLEATADGPYDARICHRRLIRTELTVIDYGNAVTIDAGRMGGFHVVQIPLRGGYWFEADGQRSFIACGQAHVVHPDVHLRMDWSDSCELLVLRTTDPRLSDLERLMPPEPARRSRGTILSRRQGAGASLGRATDFLAGELFQGKLIGAGTPAAAAAESLLMSALVHAMSASHAHSQTRPPSYVSRAEQYISRNLNGELALADVVKASGVSARSLFRAFRTAHGTSPMLWARAQRLQHVRQDLKDPMQLHRNISDIALHWGFTHFGHFCGAYRSLHGETPTETRRAIRLP